MCIDDDDKNTPLLLMILIINYMCRFLCSCCFMCGKILSVFSILCCAIAVPLFILSES